MLIVDGGPFAEFGVLPNSITDLTQIKEAPAVPYDGGHVDDEIIWESADLEDFMEDCTPEEIEAFLKETK